MNTDWDKIRELLSTAVDVCEALESKALTEEDRSVIISAGEADVFDLLLSAVSYPEQLRYEIIRSRHRAGVDNPYVPEAARILQRVSEVAAELVFMNPPDGALSRQQMSLRKASIEECSAKVEQLIYWYKRHFLVELSRVGRTIGSKLN